MTDDWLVANRQVMLMLDIQESAQNLYEGEFWRHLLGEDNHLAGALFLIGGLKRLGPTDAESFSLLLSLAALGVQVIAVGDIDMTTRSGRLTVETMRRLLSAASDV
jgi:hypothetical protein